MSLLDDVSIVVTPNGYKAGELYAVVPTPVLGAELVDCSSFDCADPAAIWSEGSGWSFSEGKAIYDGTGGTSGLSQSNVIEVGKQYKITVEVLSNQGSGSNTIYLGGTVLSSSHLSVGTHVFYGVTSNTNVNVYIYGRSGEVFEVGSLSVKEYTSADMDVTRATAATRVDEDGLIEDVLSNVPRIDYTGGGCPHILSEPERTNLVTYSEALTSTTNVTSSNTTSPDGTLSGLKLNETTSNSQHYGTSYEASVVDDGTIYTISFYIKKGTYDLVKVYTQSSRIAASIYITFSTESTTASGSDFVSDSDFMEDAGNGWYRVGFSATANSTGSVSIYLSPKDLTTYVGDVSQYTEYWGAQIEAGSYATSYIPTSGSTVTRNQDVFTRDGIGSLINDSEGVLFAEIAALSDDLTYREISLSDGTSTNRIEIRYTTNSNRIQVLIRNGSYLALQYDVSSIVDFNKVAFKWKTGDFALWVNGVERATDATAFATSGLNRLAFDQSPSGNEFYGKVKQLQVYNTALTDTQLAALTS